jgi:hypothetical protein
MISVACAITTKARKNAVPIEISIGRCGSSKVFQKHNKTVAPPSQEFG